MIVEDACVPAACAGGVICCYPDEGHGLAERKSQLDCYPQVAAFLKKHLRMED